jgi:predicted aspartyl protease
MLARLMFGVALTVVLFAVPAMARDVRLVLAQTKAAAGGAAVDGLKAIRITYRLRQSGLEGTGSTLTDVVGGRVVTRFRLGPITGAEGFDGERAWLQDQAGIVTVPEGADWRAQGVSAQYRQALGYWYPSRAARANVDIRLQLFRQRIKEALEIAPDGGLKFELWFDAQTKMLDRVIEAGASETRTTIYEDYRAVAMPGVAADLMVAHRIRSSNAAAAFGSERVVTKVEINPTISIADFAIPSPPRRDYSFARGKRDSTMPFRFVNNHIYVDAKLNGRTFPLLLDTGAANVITPTVARALRLSSVGSAQVKGAGEFTEHAAFTRVAAVGLGDVRLRNQLFAVVPLEKLGTVEGVPFHGILGYELFKRFVVRIDYAAGTMTLTDVDVWRAGGAGVAVPFVFNGTVPEVAGNIDGIAATFDVDTGSRASIGLNSPFVQKHALRARFTPSIDAVTGWGLGGPTRGTVARVGRVRLGPVAVSNVVVDMSLQRLGALTNTAPAGSIGSGLLQRFIVTFDYPHQRIYLLAGPGASAKDGYDRCGLWINQGPNGFRVDAVVAQSPAARAGIVEGDIIVAVDGVRASSLLLHDVRATLRDTPAGTVVRFTVRRGDAKREVAVTLRDLI